MPLATHSVVEEPCAVDSGSWGLAPGSSRGQRALADQSQRGPATSGPKGQRVAQRCKRSRVLSARDSAHDTGSETVQPRLVVGGVNGCEW